MEALMDVLRVCFSVYWYNQGKPKKDDARLHCCATAFLWKSNECGVAAARETTSNENKACAEKSTNEVKERMKGLKKR